VNELLFEVTLVITVSAKRGDKTLFLVEASQAGVFQIRNVPMRTSPLSWDSLSERPVPLRARDRFDIVNRAGFPQVLLAPVNFEALYQQRAADASAQPSGPRIRDCPLMRGLAASVLLAFACRAPQPASFRLDRGNGNVDV